MGHWLIKLMRSDLATRIIDYLKPCMRAIVSLGTSCRDLAVYVSENMVRFTAFESLFLNA